MSTDLNHCALSNCPTKPLSDYSVPAPAQFQTFKLIGFYRVNCPPGSSALLWSDVRKTISLQWSVPRMISL